MSGDRRLWIAAVVGGAGLLLGAVVAPPAAAQAWLTVAQFALGLPLGAVWILLIHTLTGGRWGEVIRPWLLPIAALLPIGLAMFVPLLVLQPLLFSWTVIEPDALPAVVRAKLPYMAPAFVVLRFVVCAAAWLAIGGAMRLWRDDRRGRPSRHLAAPLLFAHGVVFTVFSTDWMLALEPRFFSTEYAMLVAAAQATAALAAAMLMAHRRRPLTALAGGAEGEPASADLAKLLLSGLMFWVYLAFMQFIIIWSGNLPDEITWYVARFAGGWNAVGVVALAVFCLVPAALLLGSRSKRDPAWLRAVLAMVTVGAVLESLWRIAPAFWPQPLLLPLIVAAALLAGAAFALTVRWTGGVPSVRAEAAAHG